MLAKIEQCNNSILRHATHYGPRLRDAPFFNSTRRVVHTEQYLPGGHTTYIAATDTFVCGRISGLSRLGLVFFGDRRPLAPFSDIEQIEQPLFARIGPPDASLPRRVTGFAAQEAYDFCVGVPASLFGIVLCLAQAKTHEAMLRWQVSELALGRIYGRIFVDVPAGIILGVIFLVSCTNR